MKKPINRSDKNILNKFIYFFNEKFNYFFILIFGNLTDKKLEILDEKISKNSYKYANINQTVWLLNIFRAIKMISNNITLNPKKYQWIDIGCGNGISAIFVQVFFQLKKQYLFDLNKKCIQVSNENFKKAKNSLIGSIFGIEIPIIEKNDACKIILKRNNFKFIFYLYNPFSEEILREFILNNKNNFKKGDIIIYINDLHKKLFEEFLEIKFQNRNSFFQISIFLL
tara:strand:+ start:10497 stop:11174 length:678 start_codon:yes stop_codon:yes gene_type:complete